MEAGSGWDVVPARGCQALGKGLDLLKEGVCSGTSFGPSLDSAVAHEPLGGSSDSVAAHLTRPKQVTFLRQEASACLSAHKNLLSAMSAPRAVARDSLSPTPSQVGDSKTCV